MKLIFDIEEVIGKLSSKIPNGLLREAYFKTSIEVHDIIRKVPRLIVNELEYQIAYEDYDMIHLFPGNETLAGERF